jgi:hypothetical protein
VKSAGNSRKKVEAEIDYFIERINPAAAAAEAPYCLSVGVDRPCHRRN